jgi:crossover junction endodeoxyribonuclease RuvC
MSRLIRVLGIDPGFDRLGMAVVEGDASRPTLVMSTCVLPAKGEPVERLALVSRAVSEAITEYAPDALAIETLFFGVNKKTVMGVSEARGAILAAAGLASLHIIECTPQQVKVATTGHGGASKRDVADMIPRLLTLPPKKRLDDELDAIAVAITGLAFGAHSH